jgi:hypothetical protein
MLNAQSTILYLVSMAYLVYLALHKFMNGMGLVTVTNTKTNTNINTEKLTSNNEIRAITKIEAESLNFKSSTNFNS